MLLLPKQHFMAIKMINSRNLVYKFNEFFFSEILLHRT